MTLQTVIVLVTACAVIVLSAAGWAAALSAPARVDRRRPVAHAARRTTYSARHVIGRAAPGDALCAIPTPRAAPDPTTTIPGGVTTPPDSYRLQHADELTAVLGRVCCPTIVGGTPAVDHTEDATEQMHAATGPKHLDYVPAGEGPAPASRTVTTQYQITYPRIDHLDGAVLGYITMLFVGENAEAEAFAQADLLAQTSLDNWSLSTRTTLTEITEWIDVATFTEPE